MRFRQSPAGTQARLPHRSAKAPETTAAMAPDSRRRPAEQGIAVQAVAQNTQRLVGRLDRTFQGRRGTWSVEARIIASFSALIADSAETTRQAPADW